MSKFGEKARKVADKLDEVTKKAMGPGDEDPNRPGGYVHDEQYSEAITEDSDVDVETTESGERIAVARHSHDEEHLAGQAHHQADAEAVAAESAHREETGEASMGKTAARSQQESDEADLRIDYFGTTSAADDPRGEQA